VHALKNGYERERDVYVRLKQKEVQSVRGFMIPRIVNWDDNLWVFEMSIVHVPCVIDFGGVYLDSPPEHMNRDDIWHSAKHEEFGNNWKEAQEIIKELEYRAKICISDINTGNIKFPE
jgi:hypothetical protein